MHREQLIRRHHKEAVTQESFLVTEVYTDDPKRSPPQWELWGEWKPEDLERLENTMLTLLGDPPPPAPINYWQLHYRSWGNTPFVAKRKDKEVDHFPQSN